MPQYGNTTTLSETSDNSREQTEIEIAEALLADETWPINDDALLAEWCDSNVVMEQQAIDSDE